MSKNPVYWPYSNKHPLFIFADYDTDEETDELLDKQYSEREAASEYNDLSGSGLEEQEVSKVLCSVIFMFLILLYIFWSSMGSWGTQEFFWGRDVRSSFVLFGQIAVVRRARAPCLSD